MDIVVFTMIIKPLQYTIYVLLPIIFEDLNT